MPEWMTADVSPSILDGVSPDALRIERLWWVMLAVAGVVFAVVLWLLLGSVVRSRRGEVSAAGEGDSGMRIVIWGGLVATPLILIAVFIMALLDLRALSAERDPDVEVVVTGAQWWWRIEYPGTDAVTANEIHVPIGRDIRFVLESDDVIHSFWVPEAGPKMDMIPGKTNELFLRFEESGTYRGVCAEFCGLQHARMQVVVYAEPEEDFRAWLDHQASPAPKPATPAEQRGRDLFLGSQCVGCHTIRGVSDVGHAGPDLTHLASRDTIGAGVFELTREKLTSFLHDPNMLKPGLLMPPAGLDDEELADLVTYLGSLR